MMTATPARIMKVDDKIGSIAPGKDADLIIFDDQINVKQVMLKGKRLDFEAHSK
jgi:N-acetylglucosamine-6-phosphate deacetylase